MKKSRAKLQWVILILLLHSTYLYPQDCKPSIISKDGKVEYFGGKLRDLAALISDDKSSYSFYVVQGDKGINGTVAFVSLFESIENRNEYNRAINDYLTTEKLKNSYLEIETDSMSIKILTPNSLLEPKSTLGKIYAYTVQIEGEILKSQVMLLQKHHIKKFKIVLGGKPYEISFAKPNKTTQTILTAMNCVNLENMFDLQKKKVEDIDLTEINQADYSSTIIGKWSPQNSSGAVLEFIENKFINTLNGQETSNGNYKIIGTRLIYTGKTISGDSNNGASEFKLFLKDMIILKENNEKETIYERIK